MQKGNALLASCASSVTTPQARVSAYGNGRPRDPLGPGGLMVHFDSEPNNSARSSLEGPFGQAHGPEDPV